MVGRFASVSTVLALLVILRHSTAGTDCHAGLTDCCSRRVFADSETPPNLRKGCTTYIEVSGCFYVLGLYAPVTLKWSASSDQMSGDCATVRPETLSDVFHAHATLVKLDNLIYLGFSEESLSSPNRSDNSTSFVLNGRFEGSSILLVEATPPPRDNGFQCGGKVLKVSTMEHKFQRRSIASPSL